MNMMPAPLHVDVQYSSCREPGPNSFHPPPVIRTTTSLPNTSSSLTFSASSSAPHHTATSLYQTAQSNNVLNTTTHLQFPHAPPSICISPDDSCQLLCSGSHGSLYAAGTPMAQDVLPQPCPRQSTILNDAPPSLDLQERVRLIVDSKGNLPAPFPQLDPPLQDALDALFRDGTQGTCPRRGCHDPSNTFFRGFNNSNTNTRRLQPTYMCRSCNKRFTLYGSPREKPYTRHATARPRVIMQNTAAPCTDLLPHYHQGYNLQQAGSSSQCAAATATPTSNVQQVLAPSPPFPDAPNCMDGAEAVEWLQGALCMDGTEFREDLLSPTLLPELASCMDDTEAPRPLQLNTHIPNGENQNVTEDPAQWLQGALCMDGTEFDEELPSPASPVLANCMDDTEAPRPLQLSTHISIANGENQSVTEDPAQWLQEGTLCLDDIEFAEDLCTLCLDDVEFDEAMDNICNADDESRINAAEDVPEWLQGMACMDDTEFEKDLSTLFMVG